MREFWDQRYTQPGFAYGLEPNDFLAEHHDLLGERVICLASGEGRNAVWLAEQGHRVSAVDYSEVGVHKSKLLARERGVELHAETADLGSFELGEACWDGVVMTSAHLPPPIRLRVHGLIARALKPGGVLVAEFYTPRQLQYRTGGPPVEAMLYEPEMLREQLVGLDFELLEERVREVNEGPHHKGRAAVVQVIARKPATS